MNIKKHNLSIEEQKELLDPFPVNASTAPTYKESLPYEELDGLRFERLCYEILCSEGRNPRYNGKSGQPDYGVDIITEDNDTRCVYQCKNIKDRKSVSEKIGDIQNAYTMVLRRWIEEQQLPRPTHFYYYSRQRLNDIEDSADYTAWRDSVFQTDNIDIQLWGRDTLDSKLRDCYSVVSGVFSDRVANVFCNELCRPSDSKWERLNTESDYPTLREFYSDWKENKLYVAPTLHEKYVTALTTAPVVLVQGHPGSGKTTTTLSLLAQLKDRPERIYYTVIGNFDSMVELVDSVKKRADLPSIFILDDCHAAPDLAVDLIQRLKGSLLDKTYPISVRVILLTRIITRKEGSPYSDSLQNLLELERESVIEILLSDSFSLLQVLKKRIPHIKPITISHAEHLFNLTGGNLKLATLTIKNITSADELVRLNSNSVKEKAYKLYIQRIFTTIADRQYMKKLCALAMFDITPLINYLGESSNVFNSGLATILYQPERIRFSHSSLAEVLFYVLADLDSTDGIQSDHLNDWISNELVSYYIKISNFGNVFVDSFFQNILSSRLSFPDLDMSRIISEFLEDANLRANLFSNLLFVRLSFLERLLAKASQINSKVLTELHDLICSRLTHLYSKKDAWSRNDVEDFKSGLFILKKSKNHFMSLQAQWSRDKLIEKALINLSLIDLVIVLSNLSPFRAFELIYGLTPHDIDLLVDKTIEQERSVGTLDLALRDLEQKRVTSDGKETNLLAELEKKVTAKHLLQLIVNNGTIIELFRSLERSSKSRAGEFIKALGSSDIDLLVDKTIEQERSVGTLDLALRDLEQKRVTSDGKETNLLAELEKKVTAKHLLQLIVNNGTIFELFRLLERSSKSRASEFIKVLGSSDIDLLVDKTIEQERSVGTLDLALRDLEQKRVTSDGKETNLLAELEKKVTARHLLQLIVNNGTIIELFLLLRYSSKSRAGEYIKALGSSDIDLLVDKTIEQERSVGTLHLALRDLEQKRVTSDGKETNLLAELEKKVTAKHLLQLIVNNGTIFELFKLLQYSSKSRAGEYIKALGSSDVDLLVDKTIEQERSVGTLNFTLRDLEQKRVASDGKETNLLAELEKKVTARHLLQLIVNNGTIIELFLLLRYSSKSRAGELIKVLGSSDIDLLVDKTIEQQGSIESIHRTLHYLNFYNHPQFEALLNLLSPTHFVRLIAGAGTLNSLMGITRELPVSCISELRREISQCSTEDWRQLVFRGMPCNLINFLKLDSQYYPDRVRSQLHTIVETEGYRYLTEQTWFELNSAFYDSGEPAIATLREKLELFLDEVSVEKFPELDFKEATSAFSILWRHAPLKHNFLGTQIWNILPPEDKWPGDYTFGFFDRVINHLGHKDFDRNNAYSIFSKISEHALGVNWNKLHSGLLFSFSWALWQTAYQFSPSNPSKYFPDTLADKFFELFDDLMSKKPINNDDKISRYAIAGLLLFVKPGKKYELRTVVSDRLRGLNYLRDEILDSFRSDSIEFAKAYFSLYGMGVVCSPKANFSKEIKAALKLRAQSYQYTTKAVEKILSDLDKL